MKQGNLSKVVYLNWTADFPHIGCLAVSNAHSTMLEKRFCSVRYYGAIELKQYWSGDRVSSLELISKSELAQDIQNCDFVVINGEGTIHHNRGLHLLSLAEYAKIIGKPVFLINSTIDSIDGFDDILGKMDDLVVREPLSYKYLESKGIHSRMCLDDFINNDFSVSADRDLSGSIVVTDWHPSCNKLSLPIVKKSNSLFKDVKYYPFSGPDKIESWRSVVSDFSSAKLILTGRYHGVYAAGLSKSPFIVMPSNTYKIEGLIKYSGIKIPLCKKSSHVNNMVKYALSNKNIFEDFSAFLNENKSEASFEKIDDFIKNNNFKYTSFPERTVSNSWYDIEYKKTVNMFSNQLESDRSLIKEFKYAEWLSLNNHLPIIDDEFLFNYFVSNYAVGNYSICDLLFSRLLLIEQRSTFKVLANYANEIAEFSKLLDHFKSNSKGVFYNEFFQFLLSMEDYRNACYYCWNRSYSQQLFREGQHLIGASKADNVIIILEGGVGDQFRQAKLLNYLINDISETYDSLKKIYIVADSRIESFLDRSVCAEIKVSLLKGSYEVCDYKVCPFLDYYPLINDDFKLLGPLKVDELLMEYWRLKISKLRRGKTLVGVCQGSHIHSYDRMSNIFDFSEWDTLFSEFSDDILFINLSHDLSKNDKKLPASLMDFDIDLKNDMDNIAALIKNLDLVITPPNSVLDFSGTLEVETYALFTGHKFDFRIQKDGSDIFHRSVSWLGTYTLGNKAAVMSKLSNKLYEFLLDTRKGANII